MQRFQDDSSRIFKANLVLLAKKTNLVLMVEINDKLKFAV